MGQQQEIFLDQSPNMISNTGSDKKQQNLRKMHDRRIFSIKAIWSSLATGRRKESRRQLNNSSTYVVDNHEEWLLSFVLGVIALSISDAYMTILLLNNGAIELNPIMAILLEYGHTLFFWVKFIVTSLGMMLLLTLKNFTLFKYINGYHLIVLTLSGYTWLLGYQVSMLDSIGNFY